MNTKTQHMKNNTYHFITHWQVEARPEEVYRILEQAERLPLWWPAVYLDVKTTKENDEHGVGREVALFTKGWLPYTLRWRSRLIRKDFPHGFEIEAFGDLSGKGIWSFEQAPNSSVCRITYDWRIEANKPILKLFSFILKPIFSANHHWAMRKGAESLRLELLRSRAKTAEERAAIAAPPKPTFRWL